MTTKQKIGMFFMIIGFLFSLYIVAMTLWNLAKYDFCPVYYHIKCLP